MDSSGTKTSVRVTSGGGGGVSTWAGDMSRRVAPPPGWGLWLGSALKAGMGAGVRLEPDLLWRSLSVGLTCCLSLKAEEGRFTGGGRGEVGGQNHRYHLTCRPSGGRDCCSRLFPRRSSSSRAELPEVEPDRVG